MKKRILVVDEQDLLLAGITAALSDRPDVVVHEALVRPQHAVRQIAAVAPDLVIIDPYNNETDGPALLVEIREMHPSMPILVLTMKSSANYISRALQLRINGYMLKSSPSRDLGYAIESIFADKTFLHPDVSHALIRADDLGPFGTRAGNSALTGRQEQVLRMIADGKTTRQIAVKLGLSAKTVEFHRVMLMNRLGIHHVPGLVRYAMRYGYLESHASSEA